MPMHSELQLPRTQKTTNRVYNLLAILLLAPNVYTTVGFDRNLFNRTKDTSYECDYSDLSAPIIAIIIVIIVMIIIIIIMFVMCIMLMCIIIKLIKHYYMRGGRADQTCSPSV